jgi:hypothetical protein
VSKCAWPPCLFDVGVVGSRVINPVRIRLEARNCLQESEKNRRTIASGRPGDNTIVVILGR